LEAAQFFVLLQTPCTPIAACPLMLILIFVDTQKRWPVSSEPSLESIQTAPPQKSLPGLKVD
jgi:hypothetical protein